MLTKCAALDYQLYIGKEIKARFETKSILLNECSQFIPYRIGLSSGRPQGTGTELRT